MKEEKILPVDIQMATKLYDGCCGWPSFAPGGSSLVFTADADSDDCVIYILKIEDPTKLKTVMEAGSRAKRPCWHPDGDRIAFNVDNETIWEYDVQTEKVRAYIEDDIRKGKKLLHPCYSADGGSIYAASYQRGGPQREEVLYHIIPGYQASIIELTEFPHVCAGRVAAAPDGLHVVFAGHAGGFNQLENRLWIKYKGQKSYPLEIGSDANCHGRCPAYSPDGRWIACVSARPHPHPGEDTALSVWVIGCDGQEAFKLIDADWKPTHMSWSPNQKQMVVAAKTGLYLIDLPDYLSTESKPTDNG